jgi:hypothetical protein
MGGLTSMSCSTGMVQLLVGLQVRSEQAAPLSCQAEGGRQLQAGPPGSNGLAPHQLTRME